MGMRTFLLTFPLCLLTGAVVGAQHSITGARVDCTDGEAAGHPCHSVDLLSRLMPQELQAEVVLDMWGWTDPVTGREYALVTTDTSVAFVDVSDPINPAFLGLLPSHDHTTSGWRDVKVYQNHAFVVVDGQGANGLQVFDLTQLRAARPQRPTVFSATAHYTQFGQAHNVAINTETGYAYVVGSNTGRCPNGIHMVDVRLPRQPAYAGCFIDQATGRSGDGYTHDAQCVLYHGPDAEHAGKEICIGANLDGISIVDVSEKSKPVRIAGAQYPEAAFTHQAWLSEDHIYLFVNDESDELVRHWTNESPLLGTRTLIWEMEDLDDPVLAAEYFGPTDASDHNLYIRGQTLYMANYASGLRIVDISTPSVPQEVAFFDTYPYSDHAGLHGAWTAYPYFGSGTLAVTSGHHGLFLVTYDSTGVTDRDRTPGAGVRESFLFSSAYPNPFKSVTTLTLENPVSQHVTVKAYDLAGRAVVVLHTGVLAAGVHMLWFDGYALPGGTYLIVGTSRAGRTVRWVTRTR